MTNPKFRVIFLGPKGTGKTSTVQTLLRVANSKDSNLSNTADAALVQTPHQVHTLTILGKEISVVDTPGLANLEDKTNTELGLQSAFHATLPGPHVVVLVFSIGTSHDVIRKTCNRYHERLGESVKRHTAVVFTGVDILESNGSNFHGYIDTLPSDIKQLIGNEIVAFNNNANAPLINVLQVKEWMAKIDQIYTRNFGFHYQIKQNATTVKADLVNVFEQNSEVLERNLSDQKHSSQNGSNIDATDTNTAISHNTRSHESSEKLDSVSEELLVQNGEMDEASGSNLTQDRAQGVPDAKSDVHENMLLQSITHSEGVSRDSDNASTVSGNQGEDSATCGCFSSISRKFRSSQNEPGFTQFK